MKLACVSSVYGKKFHDVSGVWYEWNRSYMPPSVNFYLVSLDGNTNEKLAHRIEYSFNNLGRKKESLGWGDGDLPRLEKVIALCAQGYTCMHLDLDVVLLKEISSIIELPYSFIISRAFGFPKYIVQKIGFVGCTGFYIAKPESLPLLNYWRDEIKSHSQLDQLSINQIFEKLKWDTNTFIINDNEYQNTVSSWKNISLTALDTEILPRNILNKSNGSFGVHNPKVMNDYWNMGGE